VADASHELRTPVATIRGHAEMYRNGVVREPDQVAALMRRVESESTRMGDLVDDMLLLARLDQARPLEQGPVDLLALAAETVVDAGARQPGRTIEVDLAPGDTPPVVIGDEGRLRQVITNLVSNALRHTPLSSPVTVRLRTTPSEAILTVVDAGPGMPADVVPRVFDRFYRRDSGRSRVHGGTGLGLAIVHSLVTAHHGSVTCRSSEAGGSTFEVTLPLAPATS
jgi:two-component system OmpR family sensor kinase